MKPVQTIELQPLRMNHYDNNTMQPVKKIGLIRAATGEKNYIAITPGTTPRDVLQKLGLPENMVLTADIKQDPFMGNENLYESLHDGSILYAATPVEAGA